MLSLKSKVVSTVKKFTMSLVTDSASFVVSQATNVSLGADSDYEAAAQLVRPLVEAWSPETWSASPLHPSISDPALKAAWIFLIDTLNFAFWTPPGKPPFTVIYKGKSYTGYWSLCAAICRAIDDGVPVLDPQSWTTVVWPHVFRSDSETPVPLLDRRSEVVKEASEWLAREYKGSVYEMVASTKNSALKLVDLVRTNLTSYQDECEYKGRKVFFLKRAQILAADIHFGFAADGDSVCSFSDVDKLTMFADYRVPQVLRYLKLITYSDTLVKELKEHPHLRSGSEMECEIRACSIMAVEKLKKFIGGKAISVLIDYALWDYAKANSSLMDHIPIHKTESVFY